MKIIKKGNIVNSSVKRFKCKYCNTIFEANNKEYKLASQIEYKYDRIIAYCNCPICNNKVYCYAE